MFCFLFFVFNIYFYVFCVFFYFSFSSSLEHDQSSKQTLTKKKKSKALGIELQKVFDSINPDALESKVSFPLSGKTIFVKPSEIEAFPSLAVLNDRPIERAETSNMSCLCVDCLPTRRRARTTSPMWYCLDCHLTESRQRAVCANCTSRCHENHRTVFAGYFRLLCSCPLGFGQVDCQALRTTTEESALSSSIG